MDASWATKHLGPNTFIPVHVRCDPRFVAFSFDSYTHRTVSNNRIEIVENILPTASWQLVRCVSEWLDVLLESNRIERLHFVLRVLCYSTIFHVDIFHSHSYFIFSLSVYSNRSRRNDLNSTVKGLFEVNNVVSDLHGI